MNIVPGTVFQFEITADIMRPEVIDFLNEEAPAGLFRFEIGVQSTNDHTNELVKRKQNFEKLTRTVKMVKEGGKIDQHLDLIAGLPEEDYHSFRKTFNDVFAFRPEELQLGFLKMLRGTGLRLRADEHDYIYSGPSTIRNSWQLCIYLLMILYESNKWRMCLKNIGMIIEWTIQSNILLQTYFQHHLTFSKNSAPIGKKKVGQELVINWKIYLND